MDANHNMDKPQENYAKLKKPDLKDHVPYYSIYIIFWKGQNSKDRNQWLLGVRVEGRKLATWGGMRQLFRMLEIFSLDSGGGWTLYEFVKFVRTVETQKGILCTLSLHKQQLKSKKIK